MMKSKEELGKIFKEISKIYYPNVIEQLESHLSSLYRKMEDLIKSRDSWKAKYEEAKG